MTAEDKIRILDRILWTLGGLVLTLPLLAGLFVLVAPFLFAVAEAAHSGWGPALMVLLLLGGRPSVPQPPSLGLPQMVVVGLPLLLGVCCALALGTLAVRRSIVRRTRSVKRPQELE
jgi:hypothetical protein